MHRNILIILTVSVLVLACSIGKGYKEMTADDILKIFAFRVSYDNYVVPEAKTAKIGQAMKGTFVEVYFGDWCSDSIQHVPAFIKLMRAINFDQSKVKFFNVKREKKKRAKIKQEKKLTAFPTFIFFREDQEVGRIIETPKPNLEDNIIVLLGGSIESEPQPSESPLPH